MKKLSVDEFKAIYNILEKSFPYDEIRTYDEQKELFSDCHYTVYGEKDENLKGIMAVWEFDKFLFLEHFAVAPQFRNQGLGAKMLKRLILLTDKKICLEVEPPAAEISARRIEFYKRHGFFLNNFKYEQPPISAGKSSVPLFVMSDKAPLMEEEFVCIRNILYKEVYKIDNIY